MNAALPLLLPLVPETKRRIIDMLAAEGEMDAHEIAAVLGQHPATTDYHLRHMRKAGVVILRTEQVAHVGRRRHFYSLAAELRT